MRVIVTGSRDWRDYRAVHARLAELPPGSTIVHGAASGADAMAHAAAVTFGFAVEPHWPDYENYPVHEAPLKRNELMVSLGADLCLAFPTKGSRGTWHCVRAAERAGIPVELVNRGAL